MLRDQDRVIRGAAGYPASLQRPAEVAVRVCF